MNTTTKTAHSSSCKMVFGRKDMSCPRCVEMANGAAPRAGWGSLAKRYEALRIVEIRSHVCGPACGPVCTRFDY